MKRNEFVLIHRRTSSRISPTLNEDPPLLGQSSAPRVLNELENRKTERLSGEGDVNDILPFDGREELLDGIRPTHVDRSLF